MGPKNEKRMRSFVGLSLVCIFAQREEMYSSSKYGIPGNVKPAQLLESICDLWTELWVEHGFVVELD